MGFVVSGNYTYHTPPGYIFRLRIPRDLQDIVGKTEFRYSLRSGFLRKAKVKARAIAHYVHELFEKVRLDMKTFTKDMIGRLVKTYIKETLRNDEECQVKKKPLIADNCYVAGGADMGVKEAKSALDVAERWLIDKVHTFRECSAEKLLDGMIRQSALYL